MNTRDFILQTIKLHQSARLTAFANPKIRRGRSHSISSQLEDLFAAFLVDRVRCHKILVDQPISVSGIPNQKYPDISIIRSGKIVSFCDLKTALGFNRAGFFDLLRRHYSWVRRARGKNCLFRDGVTKKIIRSKISDRATYNVVVLTDRNINPVLLKKQIAQAKKFSPLVDVFVLTSMRLNDYGISAQALLEKGEIRKSVFDKLIRKLAIEQKPESKK